MRALANVEGGIVKAEIELSATPERVFRSLTDAGELATWWGAEGMYRTKDWTIDLRPGGKWSTQAIGADGSESAQQAAGTGDGSQRVLDWLGEFIAS